MEYVQKVIKNKFVNEGYANQLMLTMTASLGYLTIGLVRGWSSPGMPSMLVKSPHLVPTPSAVSWVSAVPPLGAFCGSLATGPVLQQLGRKKTLMLAAPVFTAAWLTLGLATSLHTLIIARLVTGMCVGVITPSAQVYVSECAHAEIRGVLGSLPALFTAIGVLLAYILGSWLSWDSLALVSALFPAALFVLLLPLPESPSWLRSRGRRQDADKAARWLHHPQVVNIELFTVPSAEDTENPPTSVIGIEKNREIPAMSKKSFTRGAYSADALLRRPVIIPFVLVSAIMVFQQFSGIDTVLFYTVSIFEATGGDINDYLATILVGLTQVLGTVVSMFIIDKYGRKPLLIFSGFVMSLSMAALGFYFYVHDRNLPITSSLGLLPVTSLMTFIAAFAVGYCNVPYILMGELLPVGQRSVLSSVASAFCLGSMFIVIKSYHDIEDLIGNEGVFWGYAGLCFISCVFVALLLPETKGKSLEEIEGYFESKAQRRKEKRKNKAAEKQNDTSSDVTVEKT